MSIANVNCQKTWEIDFQHLPNAGMQFPMWIGPYRPPESETGTGCRPFVPVDEQKVREIIREELAAALSKLKEQGT